MFDIAGHHQFGGGQPALRLLDPTETLDKARAPVGAAAAAEANHDASRPGIQRRRDQLTHPGAVCAPGGIDGWWSSQQRQPTGLRTFDVGGGRIQQPGGVDILVQGAAHPRGVPPRRGQLRGKHLDEPRATIGLRAENHRVAWASTAPAVGDDAGGLGGRKRVTEAVGRHQNLTHSRRIIWARESARPKEIRPLRRCCRHVRIAIR
ncbi:Uncharacterised protein [Mycobacteroides abscessus subsp. abscessus]|nr:Uncharacterised protein [Mycobacteroides abscessus subsp. abscessus]